MIVEKTYLCTVSGTGTREDPHRPRLADLSFVKAWFMHRLKQKFAGQDWCLATIVAEEVDHDAITLAAEESVIAVKGQPQGDLTALQTRFPMLLEKLYAVAQSTVTLYDKSGREET